MKKVLQTVLTRKYLSRASVIVAVTAFLAYLGRGYIFRFLYMIIFGGWSLVFLYVKMTENNDL